MDRLPLDRSRQEIEQGIASVTRRWPTHRAAPFLRIPGCAPTTDRAICSAKGLQVWSAIFPPTTGARVPNRVYELAIKRLEAKGKGIVQNPT